jgi:hypothetical protein
LVKRSLLVRIGPADGTKWLHIDQKPAKYNKRYATDSIPHRETMLAQITMWADLLIIRRQHLCQDNGGEHARTQVTAQGFEDGRWW